MLNNPLIKEDYRKSIEFIERMSGGAGRGTVSQIRRSRSSSKNASKGVKVRGNPPYRSRWNVRYEGTGIIQEAEFGLIYKKTNGCKGMCGDPSQRTVALKIVIDRSKFHDGYQSGTDLEELGDEIPILLTNGRVVMYSADLRELVMMDYRLVICCTEFGKHLFRVRRDTRVQHTDGSFEIMRERMMSHLKDIRNLCSSERIYQQIRDLETIITVLWEALVLNVRHKINRKHNSVLLELTWIVPRDN
jgi:hypothetical protein